MGKYPEIRQYIYLPAGIYRLSFQRMGVNTMNFNLYEIPNLTKEAFSDINTLRSFKVKSPAIFSYNHLPAPKTQTRSDERQRLAVCVSLHLMHEPGRIAIQEIRGLIFRGKSPEKSLCRTVDHNPIEMAAAESRLAAAIFPCPCLAIPASHVADDGLDATDAGR